MTEHPALSSPLFTLGDYRWVRLLCIRHGGILGVGKQASYIPVDAITRITDEEVQIDQSSDHVQNAPAYDPAPQDQSSYYVVTYKYYGAAPCWSGGFMHSGFP